jgi:selenide,water dikinase
VLELAREGILTGASGRNWAGYGSQVRMGSTLGEAHRAVLTDPQTSGGLLVACAPEACDEVLGIFHAEGFAEAAVVGEMVRGSPEVAVD